MGRAGEGRNPAQDGPFAVWNGLAGNARRKRKQSGFTPIVAETFTLGISIPARLLQETITFNLDTPAPRGFSQDQLHNRSQAVDSQSCGYEPSAQPPEARFLNGIAAA